MDFEDSLSIIAESQQRLAENLHALRETQNVALQLHALTTRLHAYALAMLTVTLIVSAVGMGGLAWYLVRHQGQTQAVQELLLHNTQTIEAQTRALLEGRPGR